MQTFCDTLPEDRLLKGNDGPLSSYMEEAERAYTIKSSGARLTYHSALAVLARYASSLVSRNIRRAFSQHDLTINWLAI